MKYSNCCGSPARESDELTGLCPECKEHCEFVTIKQAAKHISEPLFDLIAAITEPYKATYIDEIEMAAIWLEKALVTTEKKIIRLEPGDMVRVENGKLVNGEPTHKVIGCQGTVASTKLSVTVIDLISNQPQIIKIK